jgi:hypothetical protein
MAIRATARGAVGAARQEDDARAGRPRWGEDLATIVCGLWMLIGLAIDGWAHHTRAQLEEFFTPWHALLYSGYAASALWLAWLVWRGRRAGRVGRDAIPRGYGLGLAGALLFGAAGLGDMLWHATIGIEQNRKASLSPTHLLLFAGIALIVTSPFRSAWASDDPAEDAPSFTTFLPALLSLTATLGVAAAMTVWLWAFVNIGHLPGVAAAIQPQFGGAGAAGPPVDLRQDLNLAMILITNLLLLAPVLLVLRRWQPPFGSITLLFAAVGALLSLVVGLRHPEQLAAIIPTGLLADAAIARFRPRPGRPVAFRLFATALPLALWILHFLVAALTGGVAWPPELWLGIIIMAALSGLTLSILMLPPALPDHARQR